MGRRLCAVRAYSESSRSQHRRGPSAAAGDPGAVQRGHQSAGGHRGREHERPGASAGLQHGGAVCRAAPSLPAPALRAQEKGAAMHGEPEDVHDGAGALGRGGGGEVRPDSGEGVEGPGPVRHREGGPDRPVESREGATRPVAEVSGRGHGAEDKDENGSSAVQGEEEAGAEETEGACGAALPNQRASDEPMVRVPVAAIDGSGTQHTEILVPASVANGPQEAIVGVNISGEACLMNISFEEPPSLPPSPPPLSPCAPPEPVEEPPLLNLEKEYLAPSLYGPLPRVPPTKRSHQRMKALTDFIEAQERDIRPHKRRLRKALEEVDHVSQAMMWTGIPGEYKRDKRDRRLWRDMAARRPKGDSRLPVMYMDKIARGLTAYDWMPRAPSDEEEAEGGEQRVPFEQRPPSLDHDSGSWTELTFTRRPGKPPREIRFKRRMSPSSVDPRFVQLRRGDEVYRPPKGRRTGKRIAAFLGSPNTSSSEDLEREPLQVPIPNTNFDLVPSSDDEGEALIEDWLGPIMPPPPSPPPPPLPKGVKPRVPLVPRGALINLDYEEPPAQDFFRLVKAFNIQY